MLQVKANSPIIFFKHLYRLLVWQGQSQEWADKNLRSEAFGYAISMIVAVWTTYVAARELLPHLVSPLVSQGIGGIVRWLVHMGNSCISKNHRQRNQYADQPYERTNHSQNQQDVAAATSSRTHQSRRHQYEEEREAIPLQRFNEEEGNTNYRTGTDGTDSSLSEASAAALASVAERTMAQYQELDASSDDFFGEDDDDDDDDDASTDTLVMRTLTAIRRLVDK